MVYTHLYRPFIVKLGMVYYRFIDFVIILGCDESATGRHWGDYRRILAIGIDCSYGTHIDAYWKE